MKKTKLTVSQKIDLHVKWLNGEDQGSRANFQGENLSGFNFEKCSLSRAIFINTKLERASFKNANCELAIFNGSNMDFANLENCNLASAQLKSVTLKGAKLTGANLENAIIGRARNPKCETCKNFSNGICIAVDFKDCKLATIQLAVSQFEQTIKAHAGKEPSQVLLCAVLTQAILDSLNYYSKVKGQSNKDEAYEFLMSSHARALCNMIEIDYDWFKPLAEKFITACKKAGLKSVSNGRKQTTTKGKH